MLLYVAPYAQQGTVLDERVRSTDRQVDVGCKLEVVNGSVEIPVAPRHARFRFQDNGKRSFLELP